MAMMSNLDKAIYSACAGGIPAGATAVTEAADEALPKTHVRVGRNMAGYRRHFQRGVKLSDATCRAGPGQLPE